MLFVLTIYVNWYCVLDNLPLPSACGDYVIISRAPTWTWTLYAWT